MDGVRRGVVVGNRWPEFALFKQPFASQALDSPERTLWQLLDRHADHWPRHQRVGILVGSRGITRIGNWVHVVTAWLAHHGHFPVIIPAMGSHGGGTAQGQEDILRHLSAIPRGISVDSRMETVVVGHLEDGRPIHLGRSLFAMDRIIALNRVKLHTSFRGPIGSGLVKILTIGAGKRQGAEALHSRGYDDFAHHLIHAFRIIVAQLGPEHVLGIGLVEDGHKNISQIDAKTGIAIEALDERLLTMAGDLMPRIPINYSDILIVEEIGKNISGLGMDPNVTGRFVTELPIHSFRPYHLVVLRLSPLSGGNGMGIGLADLTTESVQSQINWPVTYTNAQTSGALAGCKLPMVMRTEKEALETIWQIPRKRDGNDATVVWIRNTALLDRIVLSKSLWTEAHARGLEQLTPVTMEFDREEKLTNVW